MTLPSTESLGLPGSHLSSSLGAGPEPERNWALLQELCLLLPQGINTSAYTDHLHNLSVSTGKTGEAGIP